MGACTCRDESIRIPQLDKYGLVPLDLLYQHGQAQPIEYHGEGVPLGHI